MMVVGMLFLVGGVGVLLTMNRLLWPLAESGEPAGSPGPPGRTPVAGGRPGPARHPRQRLPGRAPPHAARAQIYGRAESRPQAKSRSDAVAQIRTRHDANAPNRSRGDARTQIQARGDAGTRIQARGDARAQIQARGDAGAQIRARGNAQARAGGRVYGAASRERQQPGRWS